MRITVAQSVIVLALSQVLTLSLLHLRLFLVERVELPGTAGAKAGIR